MCVVDIIHENINEYLEKCFEHSEKHDHVLAIVRQPKAKQKAVKVCQKTRTFRKCLQRKLRSCRNIQIDRLTGREAERQRDRQADRQTGRQTDRQTMGKQTGR